MTDLTVRPLTLGQIGGLALRYGENGYQGAHLFTQFSGDPLELGKFILESGEMPSLVNLTDLDRGIRTITHIAAALETNGKTGYKIALALKHGNCCGAAYGFSAAWTLNKMIEGDLQAIMGAVIVVNFRIGLDETTGLLSHRSPKKRLLDVVVAPEFSPEAKALLSQRKGGKCRLISNPALGALGLQQLDRALKVRAVRKGHLVQDGDDRVIDFRDSRLAVHGPQDKPRQSRVETDLAFASAICRTSNSNTVTLVRERMLIGQGVGQTRRDRASRLAIQIATENGHLERRWPAFAEILRRLFRKLLSAQSGGQSSLQPLVACSDSFYPFADGVEPLIKAGVSAIFSTSGALRDAEVQKACADAGVTLYQLPDKDDRMFFGH